MAYREGGDFLIVKLCYQLIFVRPSHEGLGEAGVNVL